MGFPGDVVGNDQNDLAPCPLARLPYVSGGGHQAVIERSPPTDPRCPFKVSDPIGNQLPVAREVLQHLRFGREGEQGDLVGLLQSADRFKGPLTDLAQGRADASAQVEQQNDREGQAILTEVADRLGLTSFPQKEIAALQAAHHLPLLAIDHLGVDHHQLRADPDRLGRRCPRRPLHGNLRANRRPEADEHRTEQREP